YFFVGKPNSSLLKLCGEPNILDFRLNCERTRFVLNRRLSLSVPFRAGPIQQTNSGDFTS
ncbi:MAG: hypothetical protein P8075_17930, partial [Deltaproteobacteria bacterium]